MSGNTAFTTEPSGLHVQGAGSQLTDGTTSLHPNNLHRAQRKAWARLHSSMALVCSCTALKCTVCLYSVYVKAHVHVQMKREKEALETQLMSMRTEAAAAQADAASLRDANEVINVILIHA